MPTVPLSFRTEKDTRDRLDKAAEALGRNRNWCINDAIENYLEMHQWQVERIKKSIAASDAGNTFSSEEVREHFRKLLEQKKNVR